jgi:hypothetical protein
MEHRMHVSSVALKSLAFAAVVGLGASGAACGGSTSGNGSTPKGDAAVTITFPDASKGDSSTPPVDSGTGGTDSTAPFDAGGADAPADVLAPPTDAELNTYPSFKPNAPQVQNLGGHVYATPTFIPVIFAGDAYASQIPGFVAAIGQSQYWKTALAEYGVGPAVSGTPVVLDETLPASMSDGQIQTWLTNRIGTDPRFGAIPGSSVFDAGPFDAGPVDATAPVSDAIAPALTQATDAIYVLFFPDGTTVTQGNGASCSSFGGYHNSFYYGPDGSTVAYAVIPRCGTFGALSGFDAVTGTASHELAEAATDPDVGSGVHAAFGQVDSAHLFWEVVLGGGEIGDLCAQFPTAFYKPSEATMSGYTVQRVWSNQQAAAGNDPCLPALDPAVEPYYFNSVPNFGQVPATYNGYNFTTIGASIPVGQQSTIELDLFSTASTGGQEWQVQALDANAAFGGGAADLVFSPTVLYGTNGYKLQLQVTNLGNDGQTSHPFIIQSSLGASVNLWVGVITN